MKSPSLAPTISCLRQLIHRFRDIETRYVEASRAIDRPDLERDLNNTSFQRGQFAARLQAEVLRLGAEPSYGGSVRGALNRKWTLFQAATSRSSGPLILRKCLEAEQKTGHELAAALRKPLPEDVRGLLENQYSTSRDWSAQLSRRIQEQGAA